MLDGNSPIDKAPSTIRYYGASHPSAHIGQRRINHFSDLRAARRDAMKELFIRLEEWWQRGYDRFEGDDILAELKPLTDVLRYVKLAKESDEEDADDKIPGGKSKKTPKIKIPLSSQRLDISKPVIRKNIRAAAEELKKRAGELDAMDGSQTSRPKAKAFLLQHIGETVGNIFKRVEKQAAQIEASAPTQPAAAFHNRPPHEPLRELAAA